MFYRYITTESEATGGTGPYFLGSHMKTALITFVLLEISLKRHENKICLFAQPDLHTCAPT